MMCFKDLKYIPITRTLSSSGTLNSSMTGPGSAIAMDCRIITREAKTVMK